MAAPNIFTIAPDRVARLEMGPGARGRILAGLYLLVVTLGVIAQALIADRIVIATDATKTAANILADTSSYRLAFTLFIIEMAAQIAVTAMFYDLLKPVSRPVARLGAVMGFVGAAIKMFARVFYYAPLILLSSATYLMTFAPAQLATLSLVSVKINNAGAAIALVFFGVETVLQGWLIYRSGFLPRFLGVISMIGGFGWLTYLWPALGAQAFMIVAPFALVGVVATVGWLVIRGIDEKVWSDRARAATTSIWR